MRTIEHAEWMEANGIEFKEGRVCYALLDKAAGQIQAAHSKPDAQYMLEILQEIADKDAKLSDYDFVEIRNGALDLLIYEGQTSEKD